MDQKFRDKNYQIYKLFDDYIQELSRVYNVNESRIIRMLLRYGLNQLISDLKIECEYIKISKLLKDIESPDLNNGSNGNGYLSDEEIKKFIKLRVKQLRKVKRPLN